MAKLLKNPRFLGLNILIFIGLWGGLISFLPLIKSGAQPELFNLNPELKKGLVLVEGNSLFPQINPAGNGEVKKRIKVIVTAYSSSPWETQGNPYLTAAGTWVREGVVANNLLPFGTKIRIPEIFGDKIFVVEDRMHRKKGYYHIDIWFPSYEEAKNFGAKITYVEILES